MRRETLIPVLAVVLCACVPLEDTGSGAPDKPCPEGMHMALEVTSSEVPPVDILVVVDNSMSMAEEQASLASSFPTLLRGILEGSGGIRVDDLHVGVVSTDMGTGGYDVETCFDPVDGDDGILQHEPNPSLAGCDSAYPSYLSYTAEPPDIPAVDKLSRDFGCIATLGIDGCGFEQQLKAGKRALVDHRDGENAGFLRPESLVIALFLTDEEDCSVKVGGEGIFDTLDSSMGHLCLRCYHHPHLLEPVETYVEALRSLRTDPDRLIAAFLVGVPEHGDCLGRGSDIPGCLDHPDMAGCVDPVSMTRLVPTCVTSTGEAYPGRRYVEVAQALGESSFVSSICADDFRPAMRDLAEMALEKVGRVTPVPPLPVEADAEDPAMCRASCTIVEVFPDMRDCPPGHPCVTDEAGECTFEQDEEGWRHSLCELPQVPTRLAGPGDCLDPTIAHTPEEGAGWYYVPTTYGEPRIRFTGGSAQASGSTMRLSCCF
jgi:hypothetical protein